MASSSSEDYDHSINEMVYECITYVDGKNDKNNEFYVKCPLCKHLGKCFYCVDCVRNGNFCHSKKKCYERFADKKVTKYKLDAEKAGLLQKYEELFAKKKKRENLKIEIYKTKEKIRLLEASIRCCKETIIKDREKIKKMKTDNGNLITHHRHFINKLSDMNERHIVKMTNLNKASNELSSSQSALKNIIHYRVQELISHIFPIRKVTSQSQKSSSSDDGQFAELEEAQKTTYVGGQWIMTGSDMDDFQYSVVEPCLPSNGDYSAYNKWCSKLIDGISRESLSKEVRREFDIAYGISGALAYTAQLMNILSFYMDINVPKKCIFSEFCGHELSDKKFLHKVAKLNANIIHLCLTQRVDVSRLTAHQTIQNLLLILKPETRELESMTPDSAQGFMKSIEDSLTKDMLPMDESDSDDLESEFVHISDEEDILSVPEQPPVEPVPVKSSFISSVYSLIGIGAAGQK